MNMLRIPWGQGKQIKLFREFGILMVLLLVSAIVSIYAPAFLQTSNLINVVRQTVEIGIMAVGMTLIITSGEIDLSVGSILGASAIIGALLVRGGTDPTLAFFATLSVGAMAGLVNGLLVTKARIPSFIVTLGMMQILRTVSLATSGGRSVAVFPESALNSWVFAIGRSVGIIPVQVIVMVIVFIIAHIFMSKTRFGFNIYATGGNKRAAMLSSINTDSVKIKCFVVTGILCGLAAVISMTHLHAVPATAGVGREMDVIGATILGGVSLSGGRGTILGTLIGALLMSVIRIGMVLMHVPVHFQSGFIGFVIIFAVLVDTMFSSRKA